MRAWVHRHQLLSFFVLSYLLAYAAGFGHIALRPGQPWHQWSAVWFLFVFSPTISAIVISWVIAGTPEVRRLLAGFTRWNVGLRWYLAAAALLLSPLVVALVYIALGHPVQGLRAGWTVPLLLVQVFRELFNGPASEEAGWRGFVLPRLQTRFNALVSSLLLGVIWTFWHLPLFYLAGTAQTGMPMPIFLLLTATLAVYLTWLYNNTRGSLIVCVLAHFSSNLAGTLIPGPLNLMPAMTFYMTAGPGLFLLTVGVVAYFGPRRLSRRAQAEMPVGEDEARLGAAGAV
jgi:membrane protease YdiL (CAAX protease family)